MFEEDDFQSGDKPHAKRIGRELAMQYLFRCDMLKELPDATSFALFFDEFKAEHGLSENRAGRKAKEYAEKLYNLVGINLDEIDEVIKTRSRHWEFDRISLVDRNIMRIAIGEMLYLEDVPPVVSIDEAVEIARDYSGEEAGNFINGILNGVKDTLKRDPRRGKPEGSES